MEQNQNFSAKIIGTGMYVPQRIVTNKELEQYIDTSDEWIVKKTGIKERRVSNDEELPSDLSAKAALMAIHNAGIKPEEIDLIILAISLPDVSTPATSCIVQKKIGAKNATVFDVHNSCQGFMDSVIIAWNLISCGSFKNAVVIGTSVYGTLLEKNKWRERTKSVFFGDGSGAFVLSRCDHDEGIQAFDMGNVMDKSNILYFPFGGIHSLKEPEYFSDPILGDNMEGKDIWDFVVENVPLSINRALRKIGLTPQDVSRFILHQANKNMIDEILVRLDVDQNKSFCIIDKYGNTSEASIPITFHEFLQSNTLKENDILVFSGYGAGMGWATIVMQWK